ncbi:MAG: Zinc finger CCCH domain-containing protein 6 [Paramarteilia canceri]
MARIAGEHRYSSAMYRHETELVRDPRLKLTEETFNEYLSNSERCLDDDRLGSKAAILRKNNDDIKADNSRLSKTSCHKSSYHSSVKSVTSIDQQKYKAKTRVENKMKEKRRRDYLKQIPCRGIERYGKCKYLQECPYKHDDVARKKIQAVCKYFVVGSCTKNEECPYMHSEYPCRFYHTRGFCYHGDNCKFSHRDLDEVGQAIIDEVKSELESKKQPLSSKSSSSIHAGNNSKLEYSINFNKECQNNFSTVADFYTRQSLYANPLIYQPNMDESFECVSYESNDTNVKESINQIENNGITVNNLLQIDLLKNQSFNDVECINSITDPYNPYESSNQTPTNFNSPKDPRNSGLKQYLLFKLSIEFPPLDRMSVPEGYQNELDPRYLKAIKAEKSNMLSFLNDPRLSHHYK